MFRYIVFFCSFFISCLVFADSSNIFISQKFSDQDAVLVTDQNGKVVYQWQAEQPLIPASLTKLVSSYLAIKKWGMSHRFKTDFYQVDNQLWVKGFGDPYLVSEEIDRIVIELNKLDLNEIQSIHIDASYFAQVPVPGRSSVADPYNAPLSAVAANFNTAYIQKTSNGLISAESQTPLTLTVKQLVTDNKKLVSGGKKTRLNLKNSSNAQANFADILAIKLGLRATSIYTNQRLPSDAQRIYQHYNSHSLDSVLTAAMKYSNNFISNQVFLKLAESSSISILDFKLAQEYITRIVEHDFSWQGANIIEGAGLSRSNKLNAKQVDEMLMRLKPYQSIFKKVSNIKQANVFAKTGTLNGVSNYAGYIEMPHQHYRFIFMFNRSRPYGYRDEILKLLVKQLSNLEHH